jgi:hypothetical protein
MGGGERRGIARVVPSLESSDQYGIFELNANMFRNE